MTKRRRLYMDVGETPVSIPSLILIENELKIIVNKILGETLEKISEKYNIPRGDLEKLVNFSGFKSTSAVTTHAENQCCALTGAGIQCSRHTQGDTNYCGSHARSRPYGDFIPIIEPATEPTQAPSTITETPTVQKTKISIAIIKKTN